MKDNWDKRYFDSEQLEQQLETQLNNLGNLVSQKVEVGIDQFGQMLEQGGKRISQAWSQTQQETIGSDFLGNLFKKKEKIPVFSASRVDIGIRKILAYVTSGFCWMAALSFIVALFDTFDIDFIGETIFSVVFMIIFTIFAVKGIKDGGLYHRTQKYLDLLKGKNYLKVEQIATFSHSKLEVVLKDVDNIIKKRLIQNMILSSDKKYLFSTLEACEMYELEKNATQKPQNYKAEVSPEAERKEESAFVQQLHQLNKLVDDGEVSQKVEKIIEISKMIFERKAELQTLPSGIKKFESYYMPTTIKLLSIYTQIDDQPIEGTNIEAIRTDVPVILDTLIQAYQNLLDELYADTALDVSSEIAVLKDMLNQEGLVNQDFEGLK